jgi:hypothetical protein
MQRRKRKRQPIKNCAHIGCKQDQKVLQAGQKLSTDVHSFIKYRDVKRIRWQLFSRNASIFIQKAVAAIIHRGVKIKHRGEKRKVRQLFQRNAQLL